MYVILSNTLTVSLIETGWTNDQVIARSGLLANLTRPKHNKYSDRHRHYERQHPSGSRGRGRGGAMPRLSAREWTPHQLLRLRSEAAHDTNQRQSLDFDPVLDGQTEIRGMVRCIYIFGFR